MKTQLSASGQAELLRRLKILYPSASAGKEYSLAHDGDGFELRWFAGGPTIGDVMAVPDSDVPAARLTLTLPEFAARFTLAEIVAFEQAAVSNPVLGAIRFRLFTAGKPIDLNSPEVLNGLATLVTAGVLTEDRKMEILN